MPREYEPDMPFHEAGAAYLLTQCRKLSKHLPGARLGEDPEELHDVRVAIRRLRTAMTTFQVCFPPGEYQFWYRRLSQLADALSNVRDQDVQTGMIARVREALPPEQQAGIDAWMVEHAARRADARKEMIAVLDEWEADGMDNRLRHVFTMMGNGGECVGRQAREMETALLAAPAEEAVANA